MEMLYALLDNKKNFNSPYCRINASVNWVNIGPGNGLSPVRRQAIT